MLMCPKFRESDALVESVLRDFVQECGRSTPIFVGKRLAHSPLGLILGLDTGDPNDTNKTRKQDQSASRMHALLSPARRGRGVSEVESGEGRDTYTSSTAFRRTRHRAHGDRIARRTHTWTATN